MLSQLRESEAGNVFPLTAAAIFVLAGLVGGGVDASRGYLVRNKLQNACDAGVLAGRKRVGTDGFDENALKAARSYFNVNMAGASNFEVPEFNPTSSDNGNTVEATVSTSVDTTLMRIFGYDTIPLSVSCSASMSMGNADVMMVLDTTGSMNSTVEGWSTSDDSKRRITFLRSAMMDFYDTVAESADGTNARIRYGFVPYSSSVNVGRLLQPEWIVDQMDIQSRQPEFNWKWTVVGYKPAVYSTNPGVTDPEDTEWIKYGNQTNASKCRNSLPNNQNWTNYGGPEEETIEEINSAQQRIRRERTYVTQVRRAYSCQSDGRNSFKPAYRDETRKNFVDEVWTEDPIWAQREDENDFRRWLYKKITVDVSRYKTFSPVTVRNRDSDAGNVSYTWAGCIEERETEAADSFSFSSLTGMSPYTWDLDIDSAPDGSPESKWRPFWPERSYFRGERYWNSYYRQWYTNYFNRDEDYKGLKSDAFCPSQASLLAKRDRGEFKDQADALNPNGSTYLDLGILWGGRLISPTGMFASNVMEAPANGAEVSRHMIFLTDGEMQPSSVIHSSYGFEYYDKRVTSDGQTNQRDRHTSRFRAVCQAVRAKGIRIWVIAFGSSLNGDLQACASPDSAFQASSSDELNEAFQDIAKNVGELRITM
ncbi:pilus assembly protein TadG-related protein [Qipengyuania sp. NPDC077563]|uniref:pilus assembly protein TadG-related protein n=1 Tax=Qipengyuania sp. NPDC077563 TaxID=3364497 RepID=UPI00384F0BCB